MTWETFVEWFGYTASFVVLVSLLMSSIIRLRWINLAGALLFALYGWFIGSLPVLFMNFSIAIIDAYYLVKIYRQREDFRRLSIKGNDSYLSEFLSFYANDIKKRFPSFSYQAQHNKLAFFVLRDLNIAGLFLASQLDEQTLHIDLDFVIPAYRDFKIGKYLYEQNKQLFTSLGYSHLATTAHTHDHEQYLQRMGFEMNSYNGQILFTKKL